MAYYESPGPQCGQACHTVGCLWYAHSHLKSSLFFSSPHLAHWVVGKLRSASYALMDPALCGLTRIHPWFMMVIHDLPIVFGSGPNNATANTCLTAFFSESKHAAYSIGVPFRPIIMTLVLSHTKSRRIGYLIIGSFYILLSIAFAFYWYYGIKQPPKESNNKIITDSRKCKRVGIHFATNTIAIQMAFIGLGIAIMSGVLGM